LRRPLVSRKFRYGCGGSLGFRHPVVASRVGGLATIVKDGETGYLFDERSPELLATYLCLLMSENEIRESMAKSARQSVMKYNWSSTANGLLRVYRELSSEFPPFVQ